MHWTTRIAKIITTPRGLLTGVLAVGLGVLGAVLGSVVLLALAGGILLWSPRSRQPAASLLLCLFTGCTSVVTRPPLEHVQPRPLGFAARLVEGSAKALPSAIAASLDPGSELEFRYTERVRQEDNEVPVLLVLLLSPVYLLGVPTGSYAVTASAEVTVLRGSREIARYQAEAEVSRLYGLYYGSTLRELEEQARTQVRRAIDEALYKNAEQLATATRAP